MRTVIFLVFMASLFSCINPSTQNASEAMVISIEKPVYATGFELHHLSDSSTKIIIYNPDRKDEILQTIIWKPRKAQKVACLSTTHISFLDKLGCLAQVKGVGFSELIKNKHAAVAIQNGQIQNISKGYETNDEVVFSIMPDLFFIYPFGGEDPRRFLEKGIGCVQIAEYTEKHPLGRSEWIKVFGVFMHEKQMADSIFNDIKSEYEALAEKVKNSSPSRPTVFFGSYDAGHWFAPPSNSFAAQFIRDAGGNYLFEGDTATANIIIPDEEFILKGKEIDFWGKLLTSDGSVGPNDFTMSESRFAQVRAVQSGGLFYCNTTESDYHGDALLEPQKMLADLIGIFHGDQFPIGEPVYFRRVMSN
ncbi:MAG: ABC transporter substrate-binding protein [Flavobacteriales bacterium]|nr:ABC transporter substrate-binding protein [Flavobacteriales bacterium]